MSAPRRDPDALLRRIEWTVLRRLDGLLYGDYRTLFRGTGLDLADLREYQLHDDVRHIDWNVTARLQTPHVREFLEDREVTAWFLLDVSPSIDFGSTEVRKENVLLDFVSVIARLLTRSGNRVGAIFYDREMGVPIPPGAGRGQVLQILHRLLNRSRPEEVEGWGPGEKAPGDGDAIRETTDLGDFFRGAGHMLRRRSVVFVLSDFISRPGWGRPLLQLARRHDVLAVRLFDPLEMALPDLGLVTIQDAETGEQLLVDTHDEGFRTRFREAAARRESELREELVTAGVDTLELSTDDDLVDAILRFADLRKTRSQLAAGGGLPSHLER
jgi:uncharacterized protein (DUF58 family)